VQILILTDNSKINSLGFLESGFICAGNMERKKLNEQTVEMRSQAQSRPERNQEDGQEVRQESGRRALSPIKNQTHENSGVDRVGEKTKVKANINFSKYDDAALRNAVALLAGNLINAMVMNDESLANHVFGLLDECRAELTARKLKNNQNQ